MDGPGYYRDAEIRRDKMTVPVSSVAGTLDLLPAAVGRTPRITDAFFQPAAGLASVIFESVTVPGGVVTPLTGVMPMDPAGAVGLTNLSLDCYHDIVGRKGEKIRITVAGAGQVRGFVNGIYR
jgi:hypothetical protein